MKDGPYFGEKVCCYQVEGPIYTVYNQEPQALAWGLDGVSRSVSNSKQTST